VSSLINIGRNQIAILFARGVRSVDRMVRPSPSLESDTSRLAPLGRRFLNEATQKLQENLSLSVAIEDYTAPMGWGLGHRGRRTRRAGQFKVLIGQVEGRMLRVPLAKEARRIPEPGGSDQV
jgi:hypothetical protein